MLDQIKQDIRRTLEAAVQNAVSEELLQLDQIPEIVFSPTKTPKHGDIATPIALTLAKSAQIPPRKIADIIRDQVNAANQPLIEQIDVAGPGFINIFIANDWMIEAMNQIYTQGDDFGKTDHGQGKRILVEFVSANPTGPLNIVSGRAAAVGDAIVNLLNVAGYQAVREFYVNDADCIMGKFRFWSRAISTNSRYLGSCH